MKNPKTLVLIVEGPDRCGKGSFIEAFRSVATSPNILHLHSGKPPKLVGTELGDNEISYSEQKIWSERYYKKLLQNINILSATNDIIILDRSYIGEYVYGNMYRDADYSNRDFNNFELDNLRLDNAYYVLVTFIDSAENLVNRDDGKSHTNDIDNKNIELNRFIELNNLSIIENKYVVNWTNSKFTLEKLTNYSHSILKNWMRTIYGN